MRKCFFEVQIFQKLLNYKIKLFFFFQLTRIFFRVVRHFHFFQIFLTQITNRFIKFIKFLVNIFIWRLKRIIINTFKRNFFRFWKNFLFYPHQYRNHHLSRNYHIYNFCWSDSLREPIEIDALTSFESSISL